MLAAVRAHRWSVRHDAPLRAALISTAQREIGIRELSGRNDGPRVAAYLSAVNLRQGNPWCAAFVSWVFREQGYARPRSGWSPDLFPRSRVVTEALPGNVLGIYFADKHRIAHVGLVESCEGSWVVSIEGNTTAAGSREGDGVYRKRRPLKSIYRLADWVNAERGQP